MKDIPNHMTKFIKKILREQEQTNASQDIPEPYKKEFEKPKSHEEVRKEKKRAIKKERLAHIPEHENIDERNRKLKNRTPRFRELKRVSRSNRPRTTNFS
jgi:hypothetical protein